MLVKLVSIIAIMAGLSSTEAFCHTTDSNNVAAPGKSGADLKDKLIKDRQHRLDELTNKFSLTSNQKNQVDRILIEESNQISLLVHNNNMSKDRRQIWTQKIASSTNKQIQNVLTPEQKEKQNELHRESKNKLSQMKRNLKSVQDSNGPKMSN
jgi:hypothetical protein